MQVHEVMTVNAKACVSGDSCATVGNVMRRHQCGFLPVVDSLTTKRVTGVVTARDILLHLARLNRPASRVTVKMCMTNAPKTVLATSDFEDAVRLMKKAVVHQLPVIDNGKLVGVLSLQDIALVARRQWAYVSKYDTEQHVTEILESVAVARERQKQHSRR